MTEVFMTAAEMKSRLGLSSRNGDNRTLNKYVVEGKLEIKHLSKKIKLYRFPQHEISKDKTLGSEEWIFC